MNDDLAEQGGAAVAEKTKAEVKAEAIIRRQKRNQRKAWAEGYLTGICAMLKPTIWRWIWGRTWAW